MTEFISSCGDAVEVSCYSELCGMDVTRAAGSSGGVGLHQTIRTKMVFGTINNINLIMKDSEVALQNVVLATVI